MIVVDIVDVVGIVKILHIICKMIEKRYDNHDN